MTSIAPGDVTEELYRVRRAYGVNSSALVAANFALIERLRRYLPWLWTPPWSWAISHNPHLIEWTFSAWDSVKERYLSITCSVRILPDLILHDDGDERAARRYQIYKGDAHHGVASVDNAYDAARLITAFVQDHL